MRSVPRWAQHRQEGEHELGAGGSGRRAAQRRENEDPAPQEGWESFMGALTALLPAGSQRVAGAVAAHGRQRGIGGGTSCTLLKPCSFFVVPAAHFFLACLTAIGPGRRT